MGCYEENELNLKQSQHRNQHYNQILQVPSMYPLHLAR